MYKECHRAALNDDGIPKLKKTSFRMPGYRQILSEAKEEAVSAKQAQLKA